jgi:hypothetical protein
MFMETDNSDSFLHYITFSEFRVRLTVDVEYVIYI